MQLIGSSTILDLLGDNGGDSALTIENFDASLLHSSYYYFRLGSHCIVRSANDPSGTPRRLGIGESLIVQSNEYVLVTSLERFRLSSQILAVFGSISDLTLRGIVMHHSPFVDPFFEGHLELGLYNHAFEPLELRTGMPIGKMSFFDVSISHIAAGENSFSEPKLRHRQQIREDGLVPGYDDLEPYDYDWRRPQIKQEAPSQ